MYLSFPSSMTKNIFFAQTHGVYKVCWFFVIDDGKHFFLKVLKVLLTVFPVDVYLSFPSSMTKNIFFAKTPGVYKVCWFSVIDDGKYFLYKTLCKFLFVLQVRHASAPMTEIFFVTSLVS